MDDVARRSVIGAAWAAPVILLSAATPAAAASEVFTPDITIDWTPVSATQARIRVKTITSRGPGHAIFQLHMVSWGNLVLVGTVGSHYLTGEWESLLPRGDSITWWRASATIDGEYVQRFAPAY